MPLCKTLVIWWRYGKEHEYDLDEFRVNSPAVIAAHLDKKAARFRAMPDHEWRWWQVDDDLLVERADATTSLSGPDTRIYYLVKHGLAIIENVHLPPPDAHWKWYLHLADIFYDESRECWVKKDLFCDIVVDRDGRNHRVIDLDDLATALDVGLVSAARASRILHKVAAVVRAIARGEFPFPEIERGRAACEQIGW